MRTLKGYVSIGLVGCKRSFDFEVDDDADVRDVEQALEEAEWNYIEIWSEEATNDRT